jgi:hypothetical protein
MSDKRIDTSLTTTEKVLLPVLFDRAWAQQAQL